MRLGEELHFRLLLDKATRATTGERVWVFPELVERLQALQLRSMLDIGCDDGSTLLFARYVLGIEHLEGVEYRSLDTVLAKEHVRALEAIWEQLREEKDLGPPDEELSDRMHLTFGTSIARYRPLLPRYDLIVLSNVIHLWTEDLFKRAMKLVERHADDRTLFYIRVRTGSGRLHMDPEQLLALCQAFAERHGLDRDEAGSDPGGEYTFSNLFPTAER